MANRTAKAKNYTIHRGATNEKVRGRLHETYDSQTGKRYLHGEKILKTLHWRDKRTGQQNVDEVTETVCIEITGCTVTVKG